MKIIRIIVGASLLVAACFNAAFLFHSSDRPLRGVIIPFWAFYIIVLVLAGYFLLLKDDKP